MIRQPGRGGGGVVSGWGVGDRPNRLKKNRWTHTGLIAIIGIETVNGVFTFRREL